MRLAPRVVRDLPPRRMSYRVPFSSTQPGWALAIGWSPTERRGDEKKPLEQTPVEPNLFVKVAPHAGSESDLAVLSALGSTPQQCSHFRPKAFRLSTPHALPGFPGFPSPLRGRDNRDTGAPCDDRGIAVPCRGGCDRFLLWLKSNHLTPPSAGFFLVGQGRDEDLSPRVVLVQSPEDVLFLDLPIV